MRFANPLMMMNQGKKYTGDIEESDEENESVRSPWRHLTPSWQGFGGIEEIEREQLRRMKFKNQQAAIQKFKKRMEETDPMKQTTNADIENSADLREENYLAEMFFKFTDFEDHNKKDYEEIELEYITKMTEKFRRLLLKVKQENPVLFESVVKKIKEVKEQHEKQVDNKTLSELALDGELQKLNK